jgi:hypothetical protein
LLEEKKNAKLILKLLIQNKQVLQKQRLQVCPSEQIFFNSTGKYQCYKSKRLQVCPSERIFFNSTGKPKIITLRRGEKRREKYPCRKKRKRS